MHWAMTVFGLLMMNSGEPMTGKGTQAKAAGSLDIRFFFDAGEGANKERGFKTPLAPCR
jgi:hypothetical protein